MCTMTQEESRKWRQGRCRRFVRWLTTGLWGRYKCLGRFKVDEKLVNLPIVPDSTVQRLQIARDLYHLTKSFCYPLLLLPSSSGTSDPPNSANWRPPSSRTLDLPDSSVGLPVGSISCRAGLLAASSTRLSRFFRPRRTK